MEGDIAFFFVNNGFPLNKDFDNLNFSKTILQITLNCALSYILISVSHHISVFNHHQPTIDSLTCMTLRNPVMYLFKSSYCM